MRLIKIKYFLFLTFFIIMSCDDKPREDYINKKLMVQILLDLHISEEVISELPYEKDTLKTLFAIKEQEIFKNYKVTEELYRSSYSHYFFNPGELDDIYRVVIDSLSLYQQTKQKQY